MYLLPNPRKIEYLEGTYVITYASFLVLDESCCELLTRQARIFQEKLEEELGYSLLLTRGSSRQQDIILKQDNTMGREAYVLDICPGNVTLTGGSAGVWYGMQTLLQIVEQEGAVLPALHIEDEPGIANRGFYHDVTRGRVPKLSFLKEMADQMARYKLNQLQLYIEHTYLFRDFSEIWRDDTPITAQEILELDQYCAERGIELVPSLSSFGHLYKLLSSRTYGHLCELEGSVDMPFSLRGRMHHHTINVTDPESMVLVKSMISEFLPLFTSRQFNICGDETFDLGKGKSKAKADEVGVDRIYMDFVRELCAFLVEKGRRPMFWGDVILGFPELIKELPQETICLNWGYAKYQREEETRWMYEAGAVQYCCPGACGWNHFIYLIGNAYENIKRLCTYAVKYGAIGVLNTDWGDFLHINNPRFGIVGMIYGAVFSWNPEIPEFEEINRQISRVAFRDRSEQFVGSIAAASELTAFQWEVAIRFKELGKVPEFTEDHTKYIHEHLDLMANVDDKNRLIKETKEDIYACMAQMDVRTRTQLRPYLVALQGMSLFNELGKIVTAKEYGKVYDILPDAWGLAQAMEKWLYFYKEDYRSISKESELHRIEEIVVWYADYLRGKKEN